MKRIVELSDQSKQKINFVLDNNKIFVLQLYFIDNQIGWFYNIDYENGNKIINGRRLVVAPNVLYQWKNILPFGLFVSSTDDGDPYFQNDFVDKIIDSLPFAQKANSAFSNKVIIAIFQ